MIHAMIQVFTDPRCLEHQSPAGYPERPERLAGIVRHLRERGWPVADVSSSPEVRDAAQAAVIAVHEEVYVERFRRAAERGDSLLDSADNPLSDRTWEASWAAVEVALAAVDRMAASNSATFAAVRPPW